VITFLRCLGILNAAAWFGSAIFLTFGVAPAVFSEDMKQLLEVNFYPYYSGAIAQIVFDHYFLLQLIFCVLALFHVLGERLYFSRPPEAWRSVLLAFLILLTLLGGFIVRPRLERLHRIRYSPKATPEMRETARQSFGTWHGVSQIANVFMLLGLGIYVCRVGQRAD
jgi:hypothetical protein